MRVFFLTSLLTAGVVGLGFTSCAPQTQAVAGITVTPVLFKLSSAGVRGQNVTVQGRYLGGPSTARVVPRRGQRRCGRVRSARERHRQLDGQSDYHRLPIERLRLPRHTRG